MALGKALHYLHYNIQNSLQSILTLYPGARITDSGGFLVSNACQ